MKSKDCGLQVVMWVGQETGFYASELMRSSLWNWLTPWTTCLECEVKVQNICMSYELRFLWITHEFSVYVDDFPPGRWCALSLFTRIWAFVGTLALLAAQISLTKIIDIRITLEPAKRLWHGKEETWGGTDILAILLRRVKDNLYCYFILPISLWLPPLCNYKIRN